MATESGDWDDDACTTGDYVRRECDVCRCMYVGPIGDSPICDDCFYEREDFEN